VAICFSAIQLRSLCQWLALWRNPAIHQELLEQSNEPVIVSRKPNIRANLYHLAIYEMKMNGE
jgi:hypothetical protein